MVTIPKIEDYSHQEISAARQISYAIDHYLHLLNTSTSDPIDQFRQKRHRAWIATSMSVIFSKVTPEQACYSWSQETLSLLEVAWVMADLHKENICLVAMGKLGAQELNLSSDVDLFFITESTADKQLHKKLRYFIKIVSDTTPFGFGYRLDFTIRPGGSSSSLISTLDQMIHHYGNHGETWERSAMIRHRTYFGSDSLRSDIDIFLNKFSYRRHLDLNLFNDLALMRERIRAHRTSSNIINIKFDAGGIRELELLVHALQLIHGGKQSQIRTTSTTGAIQKLGELHLLDQKSAATLLHSYWTFRDIENRIQLVNDQHTYDLKTTVDGFLSPEHIKTFKDLSLQTDELISTLLKPFETQKTFLSQEDLLSSFKEQMQPNENAESAWRNLIQQEAKSKTKDRDEQQRRLFLKNFLQAIHECNVDNELALHHLEKFISSTKAKSSLYSLFNTYSEIVSELAWIFSCSPMISVKLIHKPELIDSFLLKKVEIDHASEEHFYTSLQDHKLLAEVISASHFLRTRDLNQLTQTLSKTTDTIVGELLLFLENKFDSKMDILTLGKWAGQRMGLTSDLDFVLIQPETAENPPTKLARRFIHFLQSPTSGSSLYSIDLRLRPSGNAGPLLSIVNEVKTYLDTKAQAWERQAYLMNRLLSSGTTLPLFTPHPLTNEDKALLSSISSKLLHPDKNDIVLKKSTGALLHTELTLQASCLHHELFPQAPNVVGLCEILKNHYSSDLCDKILFNYTELRTWQQLLILVGASTETPLSEDNKNLSKACSLMQTTPKVLLEKLKNTLSEQTALLRQLHTL